MADRNKRHLERVLRECAESGVPDTATPWPAIRERVRREGIDEMRTSAARASEGRAADGPRSRRPLLVPDRPLGWVLAVLSALILGVGVFAASGPVRELFRDGLPNPSGPGPGGHTGREQPGEPALGSGDRTAPLAAGNRTQIEKPTNGSGSPRTGAEPLPDEECPDSGACATPTRNDQPVPNVVGMEVLRACERLSPKGYIGYVIGEVSSDEVGPGRVVSQDPGAGRRGLGRPVELTVSEPYPAEALRRNPDCHDLTEYGPGGKPNRPN